MRSPLRILSIEDDPKDTELIQAVLEAGGLVCEVTRVDTQDALLAALEQGAIDLILADYTLPSFDGLSALKLASKARPDVPFIFVSGTLGEEVAIEALKIGATDYILKTRLSRLAPSVLRALRESSEREERKQADANLRRSQAYLAEAQKLSHTGSFGWDLVSGEIYWSPETFRVFEFDPATKVTLELIVHRTHPEDRSFVRELLERATRDRTEFDLEHRLLMSDGSVKCLRVVGRPQSGGHHFEFVGAVTDITESKRAEQALRRSESYLAEAQRLTHSSSWVWRVAGGDALHLSDEWYRIYGFDPKAGMPTWDERLRRILPEDRAKWQEAIRRAISDKSDYDVEFRIVLPCGTVKHIHTVGHPILNSCGDLVEFGGSSTDVTERNRAEFLLRDSEQRFRTIFDEAGTGIALMDLSGEGSIENNRALQTMTGCSREELRHIETYNELTCAEDREADAKLFRDLCEGRLETLRQEKHLIRRDGKSVWASVIFTLLRDFDERPKRVIAIHEDITERKKAETDLRNALEEIKKLRDQLYHENIALREEIDRSSMFEEIVGESPALQQVLAHVVKVAPTDSTVLITGETGTGKELIARAIHKRSHRAARAFISVNCSAIPPSLIASELFGHEKGAFTGAVQRRLGRFELAEAGTIFLDEIGELPLDTQIALLRILQEREFERVGGGKILRANVRVIAATNRDLHAAIDAATFRSDLYYRLNVFPIEMPPLRKRREDIPLLVEYFIDRYTSKAGKRIRGINRATLDRLKTYSWPGNIRELQNVIERSVIVCETENFTVDERWLAGTPDETNQGAGLLARMPASQERQAIESALADTRGRVSGPTGAAARLGIPASTLDSKIKTFKINKHRFKPV